MSFPISDMEGNVARFERRLGVLFIAVSVLHIAVLFRTSNLIAGGDMYVHLRLIELSFSSFDIRNVYAPLYHILGAFLAPILGLSIYVKLFALTTALSLMLSFDFFRRSANLPVECSYFFFLNPYLIYCSYQPPKIELLGYTFMFLSLAHLFRRQYAWLAVSIAFGFWAHTAAALFSLMCLGILSVFDRNWKGLFAGAFGFLLVTPLISVHLQDGCELIDALFFFTIKAYKGETYSPSLEELVTILFLLNPLVFLYTLFGVQTTWQHSRAITMLGAALIGIYLHPLLIWVLNSSKVGDAIDLQRGISALYLPLSVFSGMLFATRRNIWGRAALCSQALLSVILPIIFLSGWITIYIYTIDFDMLDRIKPHRCSLVWDQLD